MTEPPPSLSLAQAEQIYRQAALLDLARDFRVGFSLAFYRTFAVPRIAELLAHTGEMQGQPHKRSIDTGLFMYELIEGGFDSDRGRKVVSALNRMHRRWDIAGEDYTYVLLTFIVVPARWTARYGPRPLLPEELAASVEFYRELGRRMNIQDLPADYEAAESIFDRYEQTNVAYSEAGRRLMQATDVVMKGQLPTPLKRASALLTRLMLEDNIAQAVGVQPAPRVGRALMAAVGMIRRRLAGRREPRQESWFVPGQAVEGVYPNGYDLNNLGPDVDHR